MDDHHFKEEEIGSIGELFTVCSKIVLKCQILARIGRPYISWSVNKVARAVTKRTRACDKRLARLISYIHYTCEFKKYCHVRNTAEQCRLGLFQDSDFAGDLGGFKNLHQVEHCAFLEVQQKLRVCVKSGCLEVRMPGYPRVPGGALPGNILLLWRRSGSELTNRNQMENGTMSLIS